MQKHTNFVIYQAYGHEDILREAAYSILSLWHVASAWLKENVTIVVYTDQPEWFAAQLRQDVYSIRFEKITQTNIQAWRGDIDFVHRVKIKVLQDFFSKYKGNGLYVDTDTSFQKDIRPLFQSIQAGNLHMHVTEGKISTKKNPIFKKLHKFLRNNTLQVGEKSMHVSVETEMWNAGVLGLNDKHAPLLDNVLALTDEMYKKYPKHIIEQFAFSYVFNEQGPIAAADEAIFHYWNFKEYRKVLAAFFEFGKDKTAPQLIRLASQIPPAELIKPKLAYAEAPFLRKFWRKITKQPMSLPLVDFQKLSEQ